MAIFDLHKYICIIDVLWSSLGSITNYLHAELCIYGVLTSLNFVVAYSLMRHLRRKRFTASYNWSQNLFNICAYTAHFKRSNNEFVRQPVNYWEIKRNKCHHHLHHNQHCLYFVGSSFLTKIYTPSKLSLFLMNLGLVMSHYDSSSSSSSWLVRNEWIINHNSFSVNFLHRFISYNPKYEDIVRGLNDAVALKNNGGDCRARYVCSDVPNL